MLRNLAVATVIAFVASTVIAAESEKTNPKCPVSGAKVNMEKFSKFNGGKVYFCCGNCKAKFDAGSDKFSAKANHQLVVSGQAEQKACPFAGRPTDASKTVAVNGVEVAFCCGGCQGKAAKADEASRVSLVFANDAFRKGFEMATKK